MLLGNPTKLSSDDRVGRYDRFTLGRVAAAIGAMMALWTVIERMGALAGVGPYQVVWTRYATHLAMLLVVFGPRYGKRLIVPRSPAIMVLRSLCMLVMPLCYVVSMTTMTDRDIWGLFWIAPLLTVLIGALWRQERPGLRSWVGTLSGFAGATLFLGARPWSLGWGTVSVLTMALSFATYVALTYSSRDEWIPTGLFHSALWVFLLLSFLMPFVWRPPGKQGLVIMLGIGVLGLLLLLLLEYALHLAPPSVVAPFFFAQLFWAAILHPSRTIAAPTALLGLALLSIPLWMYFAERTPGLARTDR